GAIWGERCCVCVLRVRWIYFLLFPILDRPSSRTPQEQWAACSVWGPSEVKCPSLVRDGHVFCYPNGPAGLRGETTTDDPERHGASGVQPAEKGTRHPATH